MDWKGYMVLHPRGEMDRLLGLGEWVFLKGAEWVGLCKLLVGWPCPSGRPQYVCVHTHTHTHKCMDSYKAEPANYLKGCCGRKVGWAWEEVSGEVEAQMPKAHCLKLSLKIHFKGWLCVCGASSEMEAKWVTPESIKIKSSNPDSQRQNLLSSHMWVLDYNICIHLSERGVRMHFWN